MDTTKESRAQVLMYSIAPTTGPLLGGFPAAYGLIGAYTMLLWTALAGTGDTQLKAFSLIAILMGLTTATVEKHLRLAREALSVETTAQAVLKAALHNQMFIMEA